MCTFNFVDVLFHFFPIFVSVEIRNSQSNPNYKWRNTIGGHSDKGNGPATGKKTEAINGLLHHPCPHVFLPFQRHTQTKKRTVTTRTLIKSSIIIIRAQLGTEKKPDAKNNFPSMQNHKPLT